MDLRQLEILRAVAETGSFTSAGEQLHLSQSAVSRQILLLEEELDEQLFLRLGRKIRITPAGTTLLGLSQRMFDDLATGSQPIQLVVQHVKVDDHAVPDDGGGVAVENACGQQVHDELLATHHDGVAGVVATGVAHHQINVLTQRVDRLALALVTPLGSQHDDARHAQPFVQAPGDATRNTTEAPCTATAARGSCHATLTRQGLARPEF